METTLDVRGVTRRYGTREVLKGITFAAQKGEIIALLGRNGTGKSTLMNTITGYLCQSGGDISICGYDVLTQPLEARRRTGYLPEQPPLYPDMTVTEYLRYCCRLRGLKASTQTAEIARVIELTGLEAYAHRPSGRLSKGYRRAWASRRRFWGSRRCSSSMNPAAALTRCKWRRCARSSAARGRTAPFCSHRTCSAK